MPSYQNILLPTDFSEASGRAAAKAKNLSGSEGATLSVVHVVDYVPPTYIAAELPANFSSKDSIVERARSHLEEWVAGHGLDGAKLIVAVGTPKKEIASVAREHGVDLIVIGSSGERGLHLLLGSTTSALIHNPPCDVLSVTG